MTDNKILARWQGWEYHVEEELWINPVRDCGWSKLEPLPDYLSDDAAAMSLLDTLVEKGYWFTLDAGSERYMFNLRLGNFDIGGFYIEASGKTRREAIIAACIEVARKELEG